MEQHELEQVVAAADDAINRRDLKALMEFYEDDAVLVVRPGLLAVGKDEIARAHEAIFAFFDQSLVVTQEKVCILETGDIALFLSRMRLESNQEPRPEVTMRRETTFVFRRNAAGLWHCAIDNSYGVDLLRD